ncbi:MAG: response regulator transcription factor [Lachnospiraceae bacterium]|nr:response regulator transcription factor [Lachnospiraceae bacterium]MBQ6353790.1 response regulator transcription factor [Lachnospiraceae bacterium]MBR2752390.1 response regulator transcription factor [Lachnospiraceae bacterium]
MARRILVVDDEQLIVKGIRFSLEQEGMEVDAAYDGETAVKMARARRYDLILLDVMLPGLSGLEVCQQIRSFSKVPIMMLTAKGADMDKIMGLEYGADDYVTKPFNILEIKARIKAILRRTAGSAETRRRRESHIISSNGLKIDADRHRVFLHDQEVNLTTKEFDLLLLLARDPGKIYTRDQLLAKIWGEDYDGDARTVDVHIRRLREKIEKTPAQPVYVCTKWGMGYFFRG